MSEIAIYGKGGIGKSTISANLSASLAMHGRRVLQIGCDPKHDSTRLLTRGIKQTTVLGYMRTVNPTEYRLNDILVHGYGGVGCVEAGGPKPGVGCAGRGIISTFELLNQFRLKDRYDHVVYDVLGDVVCGGFAVPIRREYADTIFLVTSGEFMALYAANNILRGVRNYDGEKCRVAGILYNKRGVEGEDERVQRFAGATALPICSVIPRSGAFARAERAGMTVIEHDEDMDVIEIFTKLAQNIIGGLPLYEAKPLEDDELESVVLGTQITYSVPVPKPSAEFHAQHDAAPDTGYLSKNIIHSEPLHGCAFNGAMSAAVHIKDALIIAHSPKSCAYITYQTISSTGRRTLFERGALLPISIAPNLECTDMGDAEVIFGGMEKLTDTVTALKQRKPRAIIVISACPAGIIGDDADTVRDLSDPDIPVVTLKADGNMAGDYLQGMIMCYTELSRQIIKRDVEVKPKTVNIVFEKVVVKNTEINYKLINSYLTRMGVGVNCRFLCDTSYDSFRDFCTAELNLLAYRDYTGKILEDFFTREYGCKFYDRAFPIGFSETELWIRGIAAHFNCSDTAEEIIAENRARYDCEISMIRPILEGKKLMIITYNHELDWILQTAIDAGIQIVKICVLNYSQDEGFRTRLTAALPVEENYDRKNRLADIAKYAPDILLANYESSAIDSVALADTIPMCPDSGFFSGLDTAKRWARLLKLNQKGQWRQDERLLKKYYT